MFDQRGVFFTLIGCLLIFLLHRFQAYVRRQLYIRKKGCQPAPGLPQTLGLFGIDLVLQSIRSFKEGKTNASSKEQFEKYGDTFATKVYGRLKISTIDPQNLQHVFSTDFTSWGVQPLREPYFGPFVGRGILTMDGPFWQHSRALIRPTFSHDQLADLSLLEVHIGRMLKLIPIDGSEVDLSPFFSRLALDSSTEFMFGESIGCLLPSTSLDVTGFLKSWSYGQVGIGRRLQTLQPIFLLRDKRFQDSCRFAREFVAKYVDAALDNSARKAGTTKNPERYVLAHKIAEETNDREDILNQLMNIFLPAHEATGVALTNVFFCLARRPDVYAKLRNEVLAQCGKDGPVTYDHLRSLTQLRWILNETFRLHPSIGSMSRISLRDTILPVGGGKDGTAPIFTPKGTVLWTSFYTLHRRQDLFGKDADQFRPERWGKLRPQAWSYLPFSGGPRLCVGQQLALTECGYTVARIAQRFRAIENADPFKEYAEDWKLTTRSKNGAKVRLLL